MPQTNDEWYQAGPQEFYRYFDSYPNQERWERSDARRLGQRFPLEGMYWRQYQHLHRRWYSKSGGIICSLREFLDFLRR